VEFKAPIPEFKGSGAPLQLGKLQDFKYETTLLGTTLSRMLGQREFHFRLSTALNMSSTGTGIVNSVIAVNALQSLGDFSALAALFSEFYVHFMRVRWEPVSMYNYPLTGTSGTSVSSLPLGMADLQHEASPYTNLSSMTENFRYEHHNTGRPFSFQWTNTEKNTKVVISDTSASFPTQVWCLMANPSQYTGQIQFLSQSAPPALPISQVLGTFMVEWMISVRIRV